MKRDKCLTKSCRRDAVTRGLCTKCYQAANYRIRKGRFTEDELIAAKRILPKGVTAKSDFGESLYHDYLARRIKRCHGKQNQKSA